MALLWSEKTNLKLFIISGNPSPTNKPNPKDFAQNLLRSIKGLSLFTAFSKKLKAGMTVEAAVVLPVFLLFVLNLASLIEMMRLHGNLEFALWGTGNEAALYGSVLEDETASSVLSVLYIKNQIVETLGSEYLEQSPLRDGVSGLQVWTNLLQGEKDILDVTITYSVAPLSGFIGFPAFQMKNCYYAHLWNGYEIPENAMAGEIVYVAETGTVYHKSRNCTHLLLSVQQVDAAEVEERRNQWGRTYGACERCTHGKMPDSVYITDEGECYHYSQGCSGLKRTVHAVTLAEAQGKYRCCSRCGDE